MALVTGVVGWSGKNKFGKFSLKLEDNDTWYNSQYEIKASKGDTVEFDDAGKKYVNKLRVIGGGSAPSSSGAGSTASAGGTSNRDRSIIRQNSLAHATALMRSSITAEDPRTWDNVADDVIELARKFEAYSSGDLDKLDKEEDKPERDPTEGYDQDFL